MSQATLTLPLPPLRRSAAVCFHCGLPIPAAIKLYIEFDAAREALCCLGCEAVARTIIDSGFDAYYRNRTARANTAGSFQDIATLFDRARVEATYVARPAVDSREAELYIDGITCAACVWLAETALLRLPGVREAAVNQVTHRAHVVWDVGASSLDTIVRALHAVGLGAQPASAAARIAKRAAARRHALSALGIAGLGMMQVMMFTLPQYFSATAEIDRETELLMGWAGFALTLPVLLFSARTFFVGAWRELRGLRVSMDLPIALAILATFFSSTVALFSGSTTVYFDSISMFVFLLLAARYLEGSIRESSLTVIERLTNAVPAVASKVANFPSTAIVERVAVDDIKVGDVIRVASGEGAAADGIIIEGESAFDESLLSGESHPVKRGLHAPVLAGSLNVSSPVMLRVSQVGDATTSAQVARLAEQAFASRPHRNDIADHIARWIAPLTIVTAVAAAGVWWFIDPTRSFAIAIAVLAVTCPCALALAAPAAQALALSRLAREGLLITRTQVLEKIAAATDIAFDKTGTLTAPASAVTAVHALSNKTSDEILALSVALEAGATHPIARALAARAVGLSNTYSARRLRMVTGEGIEGEIDGVLMRLGKMEFVRALVGCDVPDTPINGALFLGQNGLWLGAFALDDAVKADAEQTVRALEKSGLTPHLLSGDQPDRAERVALVLGIAPTRVRGGVSAQDKLAYTQSSPKRWIAVGDGINDAPLMAAVDVSIAMGSGTDLTRLTADAVLLSPHLAVLVSARRVAVKTQRIINQNFAWAIGYNLIAVPLAVQGHISPATAALGMAASSLAVVANSLRLMRG